MSYPKTKSRTDSGKRQPTISTCYLLKKYDFFCIDTNLGVWRGCGTDPHLRHVYVHMSFVKSYSLVCMMHAVRRHMYVCVCIPATTHAIYVFRYNMQCVCMFPSSFDSSVECILFVFFIAFLTLIPQSSFRIQSVTNTYSYWITPHRN